MLGLTPSKRIHSPISPSLRARGKSEDSPAPSEGSTLELGPFYPASTRVADLTRISRIVETSADDVVEEIGLSCLGGEEPLSRVGNKVRYEPIHDFCELGITTLTSQPT